MHKFLLQFYFVMVNYLYEKQKEYKILQKLFVTNMSKLVCNNKDIL